MSSKEYLSKQIKLIALSNYDFFTDEELVIYGNIIELKNELDENERSLAKKKTELLTKDEVKSLAAKKRELQKELSKEISKYDNIPRIVNLKTIIDYKRYNENTKGISWFDLKLSRRIAEFESDESRTLGLKQDEITFDKIIVTWRSEEILKQIILNGFIVPINDNGNIINKHYSFMTASAGQLRTDKLQFISDEAWEKIKDKMQCGLSWEVINSHGGVNIGKYFAYTALPSSATEPSDINIDECIVIPDWEGCRTGDLNYITQEYKIEREVRTVDGINFIDGGGMCLPGVLNCGNSMVRSAYLKGLLTTFDFIEFCKVNNVYPKIKDAWGQDHDLISENIKVIFTASQLKMWKYYQSWNEYKYFFKKNKCTINLTNYEENWIDDTEINYQFLQDIDMTDDEIDDFTSKEFNKINNIAKNKMSMLDILHANKMSEIPYERCLSIYPELLRDGYAKNSLKDIKKRMILDAKSGNFKCKNKRLYVIPDWYAACEYYFKHEEHPKGLLIPGEVYASIYENADEADICRSPHLSMEHAIRKFNHSDECKKWFKTKGIYVSYLDFIDRICQLDYDGDQLNVITEKSVIEAAKRRIKEWDIVPIFYDANKAAPSLLTKENIYKGIKLAHDYSGIGIFSNMITRLWNRENPDPKIASIICATNNYTIDAAKTGFLNSYENYPEIRRKVNKAIGGRNGKMPFFFQFSKNGRRNDSDKNKTKSLPIGKSTMDRICEVFMHTSNMNMNFANVDPFNYKMFLSEDSADFNKDIIDIFCSIDDANIANLIKIFKDDHIFDTKNAKMKYDLLKEEIEHRITEIMPIEEAYPFITKYLFTGNNFEKIFHKQMYWRIFGDIAYKNIQNNLNNCHVCKTCNMKIPNWDKSNHICIKNTYKIFECIDCGEIVNRVNSKQCRCESCQTEYRKLYVKDRVTGYRKKKK